MVLLASRAGAVHKITNWPYVKIGPFSALQVAHLKGADITLMAARASYIG